MRIDGLVLATLAVTFAVTWASLSACAKVETPQRAVRGNTVAVSSKATAHEADLRELHAFDRNEREKALASPPPPANQAFGADPYRIRALPGGKQLVGILRGLNEVVVLDADLKTLGRASSPPLPSALAVTPEGEVFVAGELSSEIRTYRWDGGELRPGSIIDLGDVRGMRDLALQSRLLHVVEEHEGRVLTIRLPDTVRGRATRLGFGPGAPGRHELAVGPGLLAIRLVGSRLLVNSLLEHALVGLELDASGRPGRESFRIVHDGPIWAFDAVADETATWILLGGVEDHALERRDGVFGYIDSFLYLYRVAGAGTVERVHAINTSKLGVVTPKALELASDAGGAMSASVTGYASARRLEVTFGRDPKHEPRIAGYDHLPGAADGVRLDAQTRIFAHPLLDSWVRLRAGELSIVREFAGSQPGVRPKLGEALFFTTLMAPWNESEGRLSRFTCETCHFEGYGDGRVHHTGRADHRVSTKPLRGLYNNRPYFSRAMDADLSAVSHHEFRVATRGNDYSPWFSVRAAEFPWLSRIGIEQAELSALELRKALLAFLIESTHAPNPLAFGRQAFSADERRGAELFRERCARCHAPRSASDEAASLAAFERWESLVFSANTPLVWATSAYEKTGIVPYLHERGTRVPSLRRLYKKWPYFTNGSARSVAEVLERARFGGDAFFHDRAPSDTTLVGLAAEERAALLAFLRLL